MLTEDGFRNVAISTHGIKLNKPCEQKGTTLVFYTGFKKQIAYVKSARVTRKTLRSTGLFLFIYSALSACSDPAFVEKTTESTLAGKTSGDSKSKSKPIPRFDPMPEESNSGAPDLDGKGDQSGSDGNPRQGAAGSGTGLNTSTSESKKEPVYEWSFPLADEAKGSQTFDLLTRRTQVSLPMENERIRLSKTIMQPARMAAQVEKRQGSPEYGKTAAFSQRDLGLLDILVVIDDSGSMDLEQVNLSTKLGALLESVKSANWQIAVVTTDPAQTQLRALIRKGDADVNGAFARAVTPGLAGSGNERGVWQGLAGLSQNLVGQSGGWLRKNSAVAVVIVSDEDNCSQFGTDCVGEAQDSEKYFLDGVKSLRAVGQDLRVYGLFAVPNTVCATAKNVGVTYQKLVAATRGKSGSICDTDFTPTLSAISSDLKDLLKSQFQLEVVPKVGSVIVKVNGLVASGVTVRGDVVEFAATAVPPSGAAISVSYLVPASQDYFDAITLPQVPGQGTLEVLINGAALPAGDFAFNGSNRQITFKNPVPQGALAKARWKQGELAVAFDLGQEASGLDTIAARSAQGAALPSTFDKATRILRFSAAPAEGSVVSLVGEGIGSKKTRYSAPQASGPLLGATREDGSTVPVVIENGEIVLEAANVHPGKNLTLIYGPGSDAAAFPLDASVVARSLAVAVDGKPCSAFARDASGLVLDEALCPLAAASSVKVDFVQWTPRGRFALPAEAKGLEPSGFFVTFDGKPVTAFRFEEGLLVLDQDLGVVGSLALGWKD